MDGTTTPRTHDRHFQVWQFVVSHGQLLIRSPISPESSLGPERRTNIDIIFLGVAYMAVPRHLDGLVIEAATPDEAAALEMIAGPIVLPDRVTMLCSGGQRFPIVAFDHRVVENDWDIFESPLESPMQHRHTTAAPSQIWRSSSMTDCREGVWRAKGRS